MKSQMRRQEMISCYYCVCLPTADDFNFLTVDVPPSLCRVLLFLNGKMAPHQQEGRWPLEMKFSKFKAPPFILFFIFLKRRKKGVERRDLPQQLSLAGDLIDLVSDKVAVRHCGRLMRIIKFGPDIKRKSVGKTAAFSFCKN